MASPETAAPPRRLVIVSHSREVGGAEVYLENLVRFMADSGGWQVHLVIRHDAILDTWAAEMSAYCTVVRMDVVRPADMARFTRLVQQADLVHINLSFPSGKYQFATATVARLAGCPIVVTHHLALPVAWHWHLLMRWLGRTAARHIAVSGYARDTLIGKFGYPPNRVVVVHNGIDVERFRPASSEARQSFRHAAGELLDGQPWGDEVLLACTVARLSTQKGLFELIEAAELVVKKVPAARVVVIGEGELRARLRTEVEDRGLEHHFFLAGALPRSTVAEWLSAADLFILPSRYEGGPATALMEAMAAGCAAVVTDVTGTNELITDQSVGRLVPPLDVEALAAAIVDLMADPKAREAMGKSARLKVADGFAIDTYLRKTIAIFQSVLDAKDA